MCRENKLELETGNNSIKVDNVTILSRSQNGLVSDLKSIVLTVQLD